MMIDGEHLPNISCRKCRHRHPASVSCAQAKAIAEEQQPGETSLPQPLDQVEYRALLLMWDEFKEAYDMADEASRVKLRAERECYL